MDMNDYILWGGGFLIVLILLHGLYLAWRSRRSGAGAGSADYEEPEQTNMNFDATPPILMQSVTADDDSERPFLRSADPSDSTEGAWPSETTPAAGDSLGDINTSAGNGADAALQTGQFDPSTGPQTDAEGRRVVIPGKRTEPTVPLTSRPVTTGAEPAISERTAESPDSLQEVVVIWVRAKPGETFSGPGLMEAFNANKLEYDGDVFRKLDPNTGAVRYQIANGGIKRGNFDLSNLDALSTPGIVLLLRFNPANDPAEAFEDMLAVAQDVADHLNGELKDEHMSDMSLQTIEHCRQRIREYRRIAFRT